MKILRGTAAAAMWLLMTAGFAQGGPLLVSVDLDPRNCPNTFDPPNLGFVTPTLPTAILGTDEFDVNNIQPGSLVLIVPGGGGLRGGGIPPLNTGIEDVSTPVLDPELCECTAEGADGQDDLTAEFDALAVSAALCVDMTAEYCPVSPGDIIPICLEGVLLDGTPFRGCDCLLIVGPLSVEAETWGRTKALYR